MNKKIIVYGDWNAEKDNGKRILEDLGMTLVNHRAT